MHAQHAPHTRGTSFTSTETVFLAQNLARNCGYPVIPVSNKAPAWSKEEGGNGFFDASTDPAEIKRLFAHPRAEMIAVRTGETSGISVLDVDKHHNGFEWLDANAHRLPATRTHQTPRGGKHFVFGHLPGLRCSVAKIGEGIDVRADGGYITWWPAAGLPVLDHSPPAPWPAWLVPPPPQPQPAYQHDGVRPASHIEASLAGLVRTVGLAPAGERNASLFWAASRAAELIARGELSRPHAAAVMIEAANIAELDRMEAQRTVTSAFTRSVA